MLKKPAVLKSLLLLKSYAKFSLPRLLKCMKEVSRRHVTRKKGDADNLKITQKLQLRVGEEERISRLTKTKDSGEA